MNFAFHDWVGRFREQGLTPANRLELRALLAPRVILSEPIRLPEGNGTGSGQPKIRDLVNWEITLATDHVHVFLRDLNQSPRWRESLPNFLVDATNLLHETLDLMRQLEGANDESDLSYFAQPSISPHSQNQDYRDWTALIDITRDAWIATATTSPDQARSEVQRWLTIPYPLFKRLVFFAVAQSQLFTSGQALIWLLSDSRHWLWSPETEREAMRLLVKIAPLLSPTQLDSLIDAILTGPPPDPYPDGIEPERLTQMLEREIWLRLEKCRAAGALLSTKALRRLNEIAAKHSTWRLAEDESDEFPYWIGDGNDWRTHQSTPLKRRDLETWLLENPKSDFWRDDDWAERCKSDFPRTAAALIHLATRNEWPIERWRSALQAWSEEARVLRSWRFLHTTLLDFPDDIVSSLSRPLGWLLQSLSKKIDRHEADFFALMGKILNSTQVESAESEGEIGFKAINHPVGLVTSAAFRWWFRQRLQDDQRLNAMVRPMFTRIADTHVAIFRYGRVLLGANLIALFRVDREWTEQNLLPLFNWDHGNDEATAVWTGFLWSPRLYPPLLEALKTPFVMTASHYDDLGERGRQYAALLTFVGLEDSPTVSRKELAEATSLLPADGLRRTAQTLVQALESAGAQRAQYWHNRILPYIHYIWPKSNRVRDRAIENDFARLCVAAGDAFPEALRELKHWLAPLSGPDFIIHIFHESGLAERFPLESVEFLELVTRGDSFLAFSGELSDTLVAIKRARPEIELDAHFKALEASIRQRRGG